MGRDIVWKEKMEMCEEVVIVGGGIAGLATALAFHRMGIRSLVLERSHELRSTGAALGLFPNAWRALDALGVAHKLTSIYTPFDMAYVTYVSTGVTQQVSFKGTNAKDGMGLRSVHRRTLLETLAEELPPGTIRFSSKLESIKIDKLDDWPLAVLHLGDGTVIKAKVLIGCDGVHSVVAQWLGLLPPVHSGRSAIRGLSVFPQGHGLDHQANQFIGDDFRAGFAPLDHQDVYWFITSKSRPQDLEISGDPELIQKDVLERVGKGFPEKYLEMVRNSDLKTLTSASLMFRWPWDLILGPVCKGNVTVAGDAMHPTTPDLGQGGCVALEDAVVLARNVGEALLKSRVKMELTRSAVEEGLANYAKERRWRAALLITGAFMSGWVQQPSPGWFVKFVRETIFYRYLFSRIANFANYDCGKLPVISE